MQPFVRASVRLARLTTRSNSFDGTTTFETTTRVFGFRGAGGVLILLSDAVGLDAAVYYDRLQQRNHADMNTNTFGLALGLSVFIF